MTNNNNGIIETGSYRTISFIIRQLGNYFVKKHYCAYFYSLRVIDEGECIAGQEITFSRPVAEVPWADIVQFEGHDVIGWDYNHSYNDGATIDEVRRDIREVIDEYLDGSEDSDDEEEEESLAELESGLESEDTGPWESDEDENK